MNTTLCDYVEALYDANGFNEAFLVYEKEILRLGFDGVLYTYIPQPLINSGFNLEPVYKVSNEYPDDYLEHYADSRFDRNDPLISAVSDGVSVPITWWGPICQSYRQADIKSDEVIKMSRHYGIGNGVTLPLMSNAHGISGASIISEQENGFDSLLEDKQSQLIKRTRLFHHLVLANTNYLGSFVKPMLSAFSDTEMRYLAGLASGKNQARIAGELDRSEKYLEQVMLSMRRKVSGVAKHESPTINRNQLLYYAGLLNILDHDSRWAEA